MSRYKYSFEIMVTNDDHGPRNHFVIDRFTWGNELLPPPPRHFRYGKKECIGLCFYRLLVDKNDPPPPASLLRLLEMSIKTLKSIASGNDLRGWEDLSKTDLVRFLVKHRYIFSDDFYKQRSLPNQIRAWVELFAVGNFAEHCAKVISHTLTKMNYYKPTNQIKYYCWWKGLPITNNYEKRLFLSKPNSFIMFEREIGARFREMIFDVRRSLRERFSQSDNVFRFWLQEWGQEESTMREKIDERENR